MVAGVDVWPKRARPQSSTESSRRELRKLRVAIIHSFKIKPSDIEQPGRPAPAGTGSRRRLARFNLKGEPLGIISVGTQATNLAFAGKDGKTLYITTHASL